MKRLNIVSGEPGLPTFIVTHHWNPTRRQLPRFSHLVPAVQQFTSLKLFKQIYSRQSVVSAASGPGAAPLPERPTIVLAGFLVEELGIIRINLDACGGQDVVMVPTYPDLLYKPIEHVLVADEPSWDQPMPPQWVDGGGWSPKRTVLFCGLE